MANRTVKDAHSVRGTNPQYLIEKIIRSRIYDSRYWKEECFALSAELLVDKAMELKFIGGVHGGNIKPTPFLCLVLKMLQIQPEKDIIIEFIRQEDFKYVRALGVMYMRLVGTSLDCYKYLEPLYNDYRKLRRQNRQGSFEVVHMDELIDELLHEERACDIILPRIQKRQVHEENNDLEPRVSALEDDLEGPDSEEEDEKDLLDIPDRTHSSYIRRDERSRNAISPPRRRRSRSPHKRERSPRRHSRERERDRHRRRSRSREKDRGKMRDKERRHRSRSRSVEKRSHDKKSSHHSSSSSKHSHRSRDYKDRSRNISQEEFEIAEANAVRAKLGLAPLRR